MRVYDLLLNDDFEIQIEDGDFQIGESTLQHQALILLAYPGEFKISPTVGVGIKDALLGESLLEFRHKIKAQFAEDGMEVRTLDLYDINNVQIDAEYEY